MKIITARLIRYMLGLLGGPSFATRAVSPLALLKSFMVQKIFRVNSHVPWPVHWTTTVKCPDKIERGTRLPGLSAGCHIDGRNGIVFGANVWVGPRVTLVSMNHDPCDYTKYLSEGPIIIGDNSWLATNCVILPGVVLGAHTIVAAGAVVNKSFPGGNQILGGVPAKLLKSIPDYYGD